MIILMIPYYNTSTLQRTHFHPQPADKCVCINKFCKLSLSLYKQRLSLYKLKLSLYKPRLGLKFPSMQPAKPAL